jgi:hypothetical protein
MFYKGILLALTTEETALGYLITKGLFAERNLYELNHKIKKNLKQKNYRCTKNDSRTEKSLYKASFYNKKNWQ